MGAREKEWSHHLVICSRNYEYSVLSRKDLWSYCQSLGSGFRYILGEVLGTQDHLTLRLASHCCVLFLNPIKNHLNTCILNTHTHTHTNMHLTNKHGTFNPKQAYLSIHKQKKTKHTKENLNIHLKPNSNLKMVASISSEKKYHKQMLTY